MNYYKKKSKTISKGYRLKPATHKVIFKIQRLMQSTQDEVLSKACGMLFNELKAGMNK